MCATGNRFGQHTIQCTSPDEPSRAKSSEATLNDMPIVVWLSKYLSLIINMLKSLRNSLAKLSICSILGWYWGQRQQLRLWLELLQLVATCCPTAPHRTPSHCARQVQWFFQPWLNRIWQLAKISCKCSNISVRFAGYTRCWQVWNAPWHLSVSLLLSSASSSSSSSVALPPFPQTWRVLITDRYEFVLPG